MRRGDRAAPTEGCRLHDARAWRSRRAGLPSRHRAQPRSLLLLFGATVAALLCWSSSALALSQRGHEFGFSFGKKGSAEGQLTSPSGIAVNEKTGNVYVVDSGNNRVDVFHPAGTEGKFVEAWGFGVKGDGKKEFEHCTTKCVAGEEGSGLGQFKNPEAIAVDNSTGPSAGDVYVVSEREASITPIEKFSPIGTPLARLTTAGEALGGVAVDASGGVWAYEPGASTVQSFDNKEPNVVGAPVAVNTQCGKPGFAVNASAELFYANHQTIPAGKEECPETAPTAKDPALIGKFKHQGAEATVVAEALDGENSTGVAIDLSSGAGSGDVYVDNITTIAAFDKEGSLIQHFGAEGAELTKGSGVAVDASTEKVFVVDTAKNRVDVFEPRKEGAPEVDGVSSQNVNPTTTELFAQLDPRGAETEYFFEYGTANCKENPGSCVKTSTEKVAGVFGDQLVHARAENLQPGVAYFYRVFAKNKNGEAESPPGVLHTFTTLPNAAEILADGRAWELVSPAEKHGGSIEPLGYGVEGAIGGIVESSEEGNGVTSAADAPLLREPETNRAPEGVQVLSTRSPGGWSTQEIVTPHKFAEGVNPAEPQEYRFFSSDLSRALVEPIGLVAVSRTATCEATGHGRTRPLSTQQPHVRHHVHKMLRSALQLADRHDRGSVRSPGRHSTGAVRQRVERP